MFNSGLLYKIFTVATDSDIFTPEEVHRIQEALIEAELAEEAEEAEKK